MLTKIKLVIVAFMILLLGGFLDSHAFQLPANHPNRTNCPLNTEVRGTALIGVPQRGVFKININWRCSQLFLAGRQDDSVVVEVGELAGSEFRVHKCRITEVTLIGKEFPTVFLTTKGCKSTTREREPIGSEFWLMIADNVRVPDIIGFAVVRTDGDHLQTLDYATGSVIDGDIRISLPGQ